MERKPGARKIESINGVCHWPEINSSLIIDSVRRTTVICTRFGITNGGNV